jgi:hypothetical protein
MNAFRWRRIVLHVANVAEPLEGPRGPFALDVTFPTTPILSHRNLPAEVFVAAYARNGEACELLGAAKVTMRHLGLACVRIACDCLASGLWSVEAAIEVRALDAPHSKRRILRGVSIEPACPSVIRSVADDEHEPLHGEAP